MTNIAELDDRVAAEELMRGKLFSLPLQKVENDPKWTESSFLQWKDEDDFDQDLMFDFIAGKLVHERKEPVELAISANTLWIKTRDARQ